MFRNAVHRIPASSVSVSFFFLLFTGQDAEDSSSQTRTLESIVLILSLVLFCICLGKDLPGTVPNVSNCCLFVCLVPAASSSKLEVRGCSLPPEIANGRYQILPMRRSFSSSSFSPLSSRIQHWNNLQMSSNGSSTPTTSPVVVVPVYSSALYSCYRGFLSGGSSLISCSPGGWWQPTHNAPRCLPFGSSSSASSGGIHHSHGTYPHRRRTFSFFFRFFSSSCLAENGPHNNGHFGNEFRIDAGFWVRRSSDVALIHRPKSPPFFFFQSCFLFFSRCFII